MHFFILEIKALTDLIAGVTTVGWSLCFWKIDDVLIGWHSCMTKDYEFRQHLVIC